MREQKPARRNERCSLSRAPIGRVQGGNVTGKDANLKLPGSFAKRLLGCKQMTDIRLVQIDADGTPREDLGQLSATAADVCAQTAELYRKAGFTPPWVG